MDNIERKIKQICKKTECSVYDIYYELYTECIVNQQMHADILKIIFIECEKVDYNNEIASVYISDNEVKRIGNTYFQLLNAYVQSLVKQNLAEDVFYDKLYNVVFETELFPEDKNSKAILLYFLSEKIMGIPYFQAVNLLKMTSEEYKQYITKLKNQIEKTIDIINKGFGSRTEEASQFFEIMSGLETREEKIVYLSILIKIKQDNALKNVNEDRQ